MATKTRSPRTFANSASLARFRRVVLTAGVLAYADASTVEHGVLTRTTQTTDASAAVDLATGDTTQVMIASGAISQYARVYGDASGKVTATAGPVPIGIALDAATADGDQIEVLRVREPSGRLFEQVAASSAVTNTTTETAFDQSYTVPANLLKAGDRLRIRAQVIATATNSTDTLNAKLKIGSTVVAATGALDVANNDVAVIDADLVVRTAGGSGTLVACGFASIGTPGTATAKPFNLASTAIDTTATQLIAVTGTWSVANAGNSCRLDMLSISRIAA